MEDVFIVFHVDGPNVHYREDSLAKKSKESLRNLVQFKDLSDAEFEKVWEEYQHKESDEIPVVDMAVLEERIEGMIESFREDYALDDLKFNDTQTLRALIRAMLTLEDYEDILYTVHEGGIGTGNIKLIDGINKQTSLLRKDISRMQEDLRITRRIRKEEKEDSIEAYIVNLQDKANKFYKNKILRAVCPKCGLMLFDGWFLYPESDNKIILNCNRMVEAVEEDEERKCTGKLELTSKELVALQKEYKELFPEGL